MDMKKKLEDTYNPDKQGRKEKVVLAMSGGIDSLVTAYLLKIQKYELIAVTVVNSWDELTLDPVQTFSCHITPSRLDAIKDLCQKLGIPHQVIKSTADFKEYVIEPWMADKALGRLPKPCWSCHEHRMFLIYERMKELGAARMATGHYAKLFHHEAHDSVFVHTSNDEQNDQSALLSRLPHDILNSLILPLSDLNKKEVLKLAENFGIGEEAKSLQIHQCLKNKEGISEILEKKVSKKFLREGEITNLDGNQNFGQHTGVHHHSLGEEFEYRDDGKLMKGQFAAYSYQEKKMIIADDGFLVRDKVLLVKSRFSEEVSWIEPIRGYIMFKAEEAIECWLHPKSLNSVYVELTSPHKFLPGEIVTVSRKKGKNSKIYLTGEVQLLPLEARTEEGEGSDPKVNHRIDF